jgi:hypothetical protein
MKCRNSLPVLLNWNVSVVFNNGLAPAAVRVTARPVRLMS